MKKQWVTLSFMLLVLLSFAGCSTAYKNTSQGDNDESEVKTFSQWTDNKLLQTVPAMIVDGSKIGEAVSYGGNDYVIDVNGSTLEDYQAYLQLLKENDYIEYVDNGMDGLNGDVYTSTFEKDTLTLTVTHLVRCDKTYISVYDELGLSPNLIYDEADIASEEDKAKTTLHMLELYDNGNSFLLQLKNGHFIMNDGGNPQDLPYLLDYMETLVPEGEKPVVDAWFISHAHPDHVGWITTMISDPAYIERIYVEAFYFSQPSNAVCVAYSGSDYVNKFMMNYKFLKNSEGNAPELYRPQTGQRYYFDDITVDVVFTQEQLSLDNYSGDFNDSSTWLLYTIEGQKFLVCGDADIGSIKAVMRTYASSYFNLDLFAVFHHGIYMYDYFTDYCTLKTVLYTNYRCGSLYASGANAHEEENTHLIASAEEAIAWGKGTVVLSFPYEVGSAKIMSAINWIYHPEEHTYVRPRVEDYETHIINKK